MEYYDFDPNDPLIVAIQGLRFDPNATIRALIQPVATIYWSDEMPKDIELRAFRRPALSFVWSILGIRKRLWATGQIDDAHLRHWTTAQAVMPEWPLFRRLTLSPEEVESQQAAEEELGEVFEYLNRNSSDFTHGENTYGMTHLKATLDRERKKNPNKPDSE